MSAALHRLLIAIVHRNVGIVGAVWRNGRRMWDAGAFNMDAFDELLQTGGSGGSICTTPGDPFYQIAEPGQKCQ